MMNKKVHILAIEYQWEHTLLRALLVALAIMLSCYLYFVAVSVLNVIARKEASVRSAQMETSISTLEQQYFNLTQQLTPSMGSTMGLSSITDQSYVYRPGNLGHADVASAQTAI